MAAVDGELGGNDRTPFTRTEQWIEAFEAQVTEEFMETMYRYARIRARYVAIAGRKVDDLSRAPLS